MSVCEVAPEILVDRPAIEDRPVPEPRGEAGPDDEYVDGAPGAGAGRVRVGMIRTSDGRRRVERVMRLVAAR